MVDAADRDGRERAPAPGARRRQAAALANRHPRGHGGGPDAVLRAAGDHHLLRPDLHPWRPRRVGSSSRWRSPRPTPWPPPPLLSVTLVPVLVGYWIRGRVVSAQANPISWLLLALYRPLLRLVLAGRWAVVVVTLAALAATAAPFSRLGLRVHAAAVGKATCCTCRRTCRGVSITKARENPAADRPHPADLPGGGARLRQGRPAPTRATDPAPLSMLETTIKLKPEDAWRPGMTPERLTDEMNRAIRVSRRHQRLDHADQDPHRHAVDRHQDPGGHQDFRTRSHRAGGGGPRRREPSSGRCRAPVRRTPSA